MNTEENQAPAARPTEEEIRDYAFHLYRQNGRKPGLDLDNRLEDEACLCANIAKERAHARLHGHLAVA